MLIKTVDLKNWPINELISLQVYNSPVYAYAE